jgi:hypothetical protein
MTGVMLRMLFVLIFGRSAMLISLFCLRENRTCFDRMLSPALWMDTLIGYAGRSLQAETSPVCTGIVSLTSTVNWRILSDALTSEGMNIRRRTS